MYQETEKILDLSEFLKYFKLFGRSMNRMEM